MTAGVGNDFAGTGTPTLAGFGMIVPTLSLDGASPADAVGFAREAEGIGFDSLWAVDHLQSRMPHADPLITLAAVGAVTERVRMGTVGLLVGLRHVVWTAKQIATLAHSHPGRLAVGVASSLHSGDLVAAGVPLRGADARLDESIVVLRELLENRRVEHYGEHVHAVAGPVSPPVPVPVPIVVGARTQAAMRRAALLGDGWQPLGLTPGEIDGRLTELRATTAALRRPDVAVDPIVFVHVARDRARATAEVQGVLRGPLGLADASAERLPVVGSEEDVAEALLAYREVGVGGFILAPIALRPHDQLEAIARVRDAVRRAPVGRPAAA